jgi:hypothetical protein
LGERGSRARHPHTFGPHDPARASALEGWRFPLLSRQLVWRSLAVLAVIGAAGGLALTRLLHLALDLPRARLLSGAPLAAALLLLPACSDVSFVGRVTVGNPTDFPVNVEVSGGRGEQWLSLGSAEANSEVTTRDVVDQGDVWVFRFDYLGAHGARVEMSRADLARAGWRVEVPQTLDEDLRAMGFRPPP